jgi:hypothetical protein
MALKQDDFVRAVVKLNELTRSHVVKWTRSNSPLGGPQSGVPASLELKSSISFQAVHEGRILRITQYEYVSPAWKTGTYKYILEMMNQEGRTAFEFPDVAGISDLFRSVQTQELDIEEFIKSLTSA